MKIYPKDCVAAGYCLIPGTRDFFRKHNLDWRAFVREGIDSEILEATGDWMAMELIRSKKEKQ